MLMMRNDEMDPTEITPHLCLVHVVCKIIFFLHKCVCQCISENNMADSNPLLDTGTISLSNHNFFSSKKQQIPNCRKSISKRRKLTEASVHISH